MGLFTANPFKPFVLQGVLILTAVVLRALK